MRERASLLAFGLASLVLGVVLVLSGGRDARPSIRLAGSTGGGGLGALAVAVYKIVYLKLPEYRVTPPQGTGGSVEIARLVGSGQVDFGFSSEIGEAYQGVGQWTGNPYPGLRTIYAFSYGTQQVITLAESGIRTFADMRGKRICVGPAGSGGAGRAETVVLPAHGLHRDSDYTISWLPYSAGMEALRDGSIDVMFISMSAPTPAVMELAATSRIFLVPLDTDVAQRLVEAEAGKLTLSEIAPDVYGRNQTNTEPVAALEVVVALATHAGAPEDTVYRVTRAHWEHLPLVHQASTTARHIRLDTAFDALPAPLHPGAERYYREIGVWPPEARSTTGE